jgi:flagellin-specific chaperone FliS
VSLKNNEKKEKVVKTMKKIAVGLILLVVLATFVVYAEETSTETERGKAKAERMIKLCERAEDKIGSILGRADNKEAEKLFRDASKELEKAQRFYEEGQYEKAIESCLETMHLFKECAVLIKEEAGEGIKDRLYGQIERLESYISRVKEKVENEEIIALLNDAESQLQEAKRYIEQGELRKAQSAIREATEILKGLREEWKSIYQEKIEERLENLIETAKRRVQIYEQALETLKEEGYDVEDLEWELEGITSDLNNIERLIAEGTYEEAVSQMRSIYRAMQELQQKLRRIRNEP